MKIHRKAGKTALAVNHKIQQSSLPLADKVKYKPGVYWYVAPTYAQAKEIVWRDPEMITKYLPDEIVVKKNESELSVTLSSGSIIILKGADKPDSLRGPNPLGVILDEVYLMKQEIYTEIILPIAIANPKMWLWLLGTPKPQGSYWRSLYEDFARREQAGDKDYFTLTLDVETSGILSQEQIDQAKSIMTEAGYQQEFMCRETEGDGVVFRGVDKIIYGPYIEPKEGKYQWGIDLAKLVDWTVVCGINRTNHCLEVFDRYNQIDYNLQKARIEATIRRLGMGLINMDVTGVGQPIMDDLRAKGLYIEGITFTEAMKGNLVTNLAIAIEQGLLKIPNIPELVEELTIFGYEITKSGRIRYGAPEGFHDDCVMALALAWWEIGTKISATGSPINRLLNNKEPRKTGGDSE